MPEDRHARAPQPREVDRSVGVVVAVGRQGIADEVRDRPGAGAVVAGRDHDGAGVAQGCRRPPARDDRQRLRIGVADVGHGRVALDREIEGRPIPVEVAGPGPAGDAVERVPGRRAVMGRVPGLHGEARAAELDPVQDFRRPEFLHPGERVPHALPPGRRAVQHEDVGDALAPQRRRDGEARLTGAHDDRRMDGRSVRHRPRRHPGDGGVAQRREFGAGLVGEGCGGGVVHATRSVCASEEGRTAILRRRAARTRP